MYSSKESDIAAYNNWVNDGKEIKGRKVPFRDEMVTVPTFAET